MPQLFDPAEKNLFGYLSRALDTFEARPLADVDSLVLACLSYFRYQGDAVRASGGAPLRDLFRARTVPLEQWQALAPSSPDPETREVLEAVLALPVKYRDVVYLHYYEGYTAGEIAGLLGRNVNTVYTLLTRARQRLKETLEGGDHP